MARPTRTYKIKVSPAGFDMIIDSHARLVRAARTLLPYGVALHAALHHLGALDEDAQLSAVLDFPRFTLGGGRSGTELFVGAPRGMSQLADKILADWSGRIPREQSPGKSDLYLIALRTMLEAPVAQLLSAYSRVASDGDIGGESRK